MATLLHRHRCTRIVHKALAEVRPQFRLHHRHGVHGVPHWSRVWATLLHTALEFRGENCPPYLTHHRRS